MRSAFVRVIALVHVAAFGLTPGLAAEGQQKEWRAIAASAVERTFTTAMSAKKPTEAEAIADARSACAERNKDCTVVATFDAGCRYVMLGGRPVSPTVLEPFFLVGTTPEDAQARCRTLGLICTREPQGGCMD